MLVFLCICVYTGEGLLFLIWKNTCFKLQSFRQPAGGDSFGAEQSLSVKKSLKKGLKTKYFHNEFIVSIGSF